MNKQELESQLNKLREEYEKNKKSILIAYCKTNNTVSIGDRITSVRGESIRVDKITFTFSFRVETPECAYHGVELKKDLTERKDKRRSVILQHNLKVNHGSIKVF